MTAQIIRLRADGTPSTAVPASPGSLWQWEIRADGNLVRSGRDRGKGFPVLASVVDAYVPDVLLDEGHEIRSLTVEITEVRDAPSRGPTR